MLILAIEACLGECSVALLNGYGAISYILESRAHKQSEKLILMIEQVLEKNNITYEELDYLAVSNGPGSFTGIRIGVATANAIAFAAGKKVIGINCLETIAFGKDEKICSVLDAGRNQVYAQKFINRIPHSAIELVEYSLVSEFAAGFKIIGNKFADEINVPNAKNVGIAALKYLQNYNTELLNEVDPLYIRLPDAKIKII
ncbi:tRNA (adenosine(37)-N6)-threonylcarbamoyltransferase complex dimerization subunit type 1 TsaB [Holosporaceae bacterium 'Namur']|nr:tRNA (adenosine(37)-N6)-threonylcarbamoyltransferase complex dimerization subunit type 1 TsaB [Holosporaceae bacterium 'Namur']